jgi:hypothetical protein
MFRRLYGFLVQMRDTNRRAKTAIAELDHIFRREGYDYSELDSIVFQTMVKQAMNEGAEKAFADLMSVVSSIKRTGRSELGKSALLLSVYRARSRSIKILRKADRGSPDN